MSRRLLLVWSLGWFASFVATGCASGLFMTRKEKIPEGTEDKWAIVGREGRGSRKMEKEDPLDRFLMSDKAREINRNVGFE